MSEIETQKIIESLLFASSNRMDLKELSELSEKSEKAVLKALDALETKYLDDSTSLVIHHDEGWWKLGLKSDYLPFAEKLMPSTELARPVVETLAMIAWKSPILQSDLVKLRSPVVYEHIMELEKLHLITRVRKGRSYIVKVTEKFHDYFDIPKEKAESLFKDYVEPEAEEVDSTFNKGDSFEETDSERDLRLIAEIKNNTIDPSAIIASDKAFLEDFDKRLLEIEKQSRSVDSALKETSELEEVSLENSAVDDGKDTTKNVLEGEDVFEERVFSEEELEKDKVRDL